MKNDLNNQYIIVETESGLDRLVDDFADKKIVAVDMEADSMFHFKEKVCLLQMAASDYPNVVIDPLKVKDLSGLKPLFADPGVKKIFHGADFDVRSLYRDYGIVINNLFDTEIGSRYVGRRETGLAAVINDRFNVRLEKKYQKKDWSQRPLPEAMVEYSAGDVNFLLDLEEILQKELTEKGRLEWVIEECELQSQVRPAETNGDPLFMKVKGAGRLRPENLVILENLLKLRVKIAEKKDKPLFKIVGTGSLLQLAVQCPDTSDSLKKTRLLSPGQMSMFGKYVVEQIQKGLQVDPAKMPVYPKFSKPALDGEVPGRMAVLKTWRDAEAEKLSLDPSLLFTKHHLTAIAVKIPRTIEELYEIHALKNWQKREFGEKIIKILN